MALLEEIRKPKKYQRHRHPDFIVTHPKEAQSFILIGKGSSFPPEHDHIILCNGQN